MKKTGRKTLSVFLSLLMMLSCCSILGGVFVLEAGAAGSTAVSSYHCFALNFYQDESTLTVSGVEGGVDNKVRDQSSVWNVATNGVRNGNPAEHGAATAYKYVDYRLNKTISSLGISLNLNNKNSIACGNVMGVALHADSYGNYDVGAHASYSSQTGLTDLTVPLYGGDLPSVGTKTVNVSSYNVVFSNTSGLGHDHYNRAVIYIVVHDTTNLYNEVNSASTKNALNNSASYSTSSWNTFKACYDDAVARLTNTRDQNVINAACTNLVNARNALKPSFSIQYRNANGEAFGAPVSYAYSNTTATLRTDYPQKTGYTFVGWSFGGTTYPTSKVAHDFGGTADGGTIDMTAAYSENSYTISFNSNGGNAVAPKTLKYTESYSLPAASKAGYTFAGWKNGNATYAANQQVQRLVAGNNGTIELTALWTENSYTVSYDLSGGTGAEGASYEGGTYKYESEYVTLPAAPSKTGYSFVGWIVGGEVKSAGATVNKLSADNNGAYTITAKWDDNTYSVVYDTDGGSVVATGNYKYSQEFSLPSAPTKTGYTFAGWVYNETTYQPGDKLSMLNPTNGATVTIKAAWTENTYTLKFDADGGSESADKELNYTDSYILPSSSKTGYTFLGWKDASNRVYNAGDAVSMLAASGEFTLTAQWEVTKYELIAPAETVNYKISALPEEVDYFTPVTFTVTVDEAYNRNPLVVSATNCSFTDNGDGSYTINEARGDVTITVSDQTTINSYDVTFFDEDGVTVLRDTQKVNHGEYATAPEQDPTKPESSTDGQIIRYSFIGWRDSNSGTVVKDITKFAITDDTVFTAVYEEGIFYTLIFKSQDGTAVLQKEFIKQGESSLFRASRPYKADTLQYDYTLIGWSKSANSTTKDFDVNEEITPTGDLTLYAAFSQVTQEYALSMPEPVNFTVTTPDDIDISKVPYGTEVEISIALDKAYDRSNIVLRANNDIISGSDNNGVFTYIYKVGDGVVLPTDPTKPVNTNVTFTVDGVKKNVYTATVPTGTGYTIVDEGDVNRTAIEDGKSYAFKVNLDAAYNRSEVVVKLGDTVITPNASGVYTIANVKDDIRNITVSGIKLNEYTVTFVNYDDSVLLTKTVTHGDKVLYDIAAPEKEKTAKHYFVFTGWDFDIENEAITADTVIKAQFEIGGINTYKVNFIVDGKTVKSYDVKYGEAAVYDGETPIRASDVQYDYTFKAWDKSYSEIYTDTDVTAIFDAVIRSYTVTFMNGDIKLAEYQIAYGNAATYGEEVPTKVSDALYCYTFSGWSEDYSNITGNLVVNATFDSREHSLQTIRQEATCVNNGYIRQVCEYCDYIKNETPIIANGHTWGEWVTTAEPTHTTVGRKERACSCGAVDVESINKLPEHSFNATTSVDATCTKDGYITYVCLCGATEYKVVPRLGHLCENWTEIIEPTCDKAGAREGECARCGKMFEEYIEPTGHIYGEYTKNENGTQTRVCDVCGNVETTLIPADPENPADDNTTEFVKFWRNFFSWLRELITNIKRLVGLIHE